MNSVAEAIYTQTPMLCMGLFNDQFDNCQRATDKGFAVPVRRADLLSNSTEDVAAFLGDALDGLLVHRASDVRASIQRAWLHNVAAGGVDRAVQLVETTALLGLKGMQDMVRPWYALSWWRRLGLDVAAVLLISLVLLPVGLWKLVLVAWRRCRRESSVSQQPTVAKTKAE